MFKAYPILVKPIYKEKIWGGKILGKYFNIPKNKKIGEVWFFAHQNNNDSKILNGKYKNQKLSFLMRYYGKDLLGEKIYKKYNKKFPLLFKFIEANDFLSIQVHPDDKYAFEKEKCFGKTELWYIIQSKKDSLIYLSFKKKISKNKLKNILGTREILKYLKKYKTQKNDFFFIPSGTVHSLGKNNIILEIQQNSDITYRIYDWNRKFNRKLHLKDALNVITFNKNAGKIKPKVKNYLKFKEEEIINCKYFSIKTMEVEKNINYWYNNYNINFIVILQGKIIIKYNQEKYGFKKGEIVFIPYKLNNFLIKIMKNTKVLFVKIN